MMAVEEILLIVAVGTAVGMGVRAAMTHTLKLKYLGAMQTATRASGGPGQYEPYDQHTPNTVSEQQSWSKAVQRGDGSYHRDDKFSTAVEPGAKEIESTDVTADDWWK